MILKLTSSIKPELKSQILFKGTFLALLGVILLLGAGIFLSPKSIENWGLPLFGTAFGLMAWGMIPYRRLCALERTPQLMCLSEEGNLQYFSKGKPILTLPVSIIATMTFRATPRLYGIELKLNKPASEKIIVFGGPSVLRPLQKNADLHTCDLFFPYFSERSFKRLHEKLYGNE